MLNNPFIPCFVQWTWTMELMIIHSDDSYLQTKTSNRLTDRTWEVSITSSLKRRFVLVQDEQWSFDESEQIWTSSHWTSFQVHFQVPFDRNEKDLCPERIRCIKGFLIEKQNEFDLRFGLSMGTSTSWLQLGWTAFWTDTQSERKLLLWRNAHICIFIYALSEETYKIQN